MNVRSLSRSIVALAAFAAMSCASSSDLKQIQDQIADLQEEVAALKRTASSREEVQSINTRIGEQTAALLKSNATLVSKVDQIEDKLNSTQGTQEQSNYRVDKLVQQLAQIQQQVDELRAGTRPATVMPGGSAPLGSSGAPPAMPPPAEAVPVPAPSTESAMELYQTAYRDYQQGRYDMAIAGFRDFIERNPGSDLADNAAYWVGESFYSQKKYKESVTQFDRVVSQYPRSEKVPSALLKKGYAYISLGDKAQGIVQLQYVVHEHPRSPEAGKARDELKKLGAEKR